MAPHDHDMGLECNGDHSDPHKGSWKGHVLPGCVFIIWGAWWSWCILTSYICHRESGRPYRSRAWFPLRLPGRVRRSLWFLEPALKIAVPAVGVSLELLLDHDPVEYRNLVCPKGSLYAGRFSLSHLNNWQHAASYPAFVLSGLVDIAAAYVRFPPGTCQAVLGCAFGVMAFLMGTHEKHEPQDKVVHWLLFVAMLLSTATVFLELALPRNVLAGVAKATAVLLQGAWLVQIASIEFEGRPQWSHDYSGGAIVAPVAFCSIAVLVLASVLAFYLLLVLLSRRGLLQGAALVPALEAEGEEESEQHEENCRSCELPCYHPIHGCFDSANHSEHSADVDVEGGGGEGLPGASSPKQRASSRPMSLQLAAATHYPSSL
ncbi:hypothetical protein D9Q98_008804 [Chlorella vulgaris]|uniref:Transmembrane protein 45B n=1 Tax=Chlorella vulgaris TaxID=3077 RepID=A0A9D4YUF7_CHLVU|nr:hypothetical protein D9Q98_008804 [Chlorella vulgaris]